MKPTLRLLTAALAAVLLALSALPAFATSWNLQSDFSTTSNPNGAWEFGWMQDGTGQWHRYNQLDSFTEWPTSLVWHDTSIPSDNYTPVVWKNTGAVAKDGVAPGEISLHPGERVEEHQKFSVVRWTSPLTGTVAVNATFGEGGTGDYGVMAYFVYADGISLWEIPLTFASESFNSNLYVTAGETIDFMVGLGYSAGNTPLDLTITAVPDAASTLSLVGLAFTGLAMLRRRACRAV
jgi:hypothetical protein